MEEAEMIIAKNRSFKVANKYTLKKECCHKELQFLANISKLFTIPHFYIFLKILKNLPIGRPILAGYDWILTPASIFAGHFLKEFYSKFELILMDSLRLVKYLENANFDENVFVFTID